MGARNYLFEHKKTLTIVSIAFATFLLTSIVYNLNRTKPVHTHRSHEFNTLHSSDTKEIVVSQKNADSVNTISGATTVDAKSYREDNSIPTHTVEVVSPVAPKKPSEPVSPKSSALPAQHHPASANSNSTPDDSNSSVTDTTQISNVRVRVKDRTQREINNQEVSTGEESLKLTIREATSTQ